MCIVLLAVSCNLHCMKSNILLLPLLDLSVILFLPEPFPHL